MIKLFTTADLSDFSAQALYKIVLAMDEFSLAEENVSYLPSVSDCIDSAQGPLEEGDFVIIAAPKDEFLNAKFTLQSKYGFAGGVSNEIAEKIAESGIDSSTIDFNAETDFPQGSVIHPSENGIGSGFSVEIFNGLCTLLPLDFSSLDTILDYYIGTYFDPARLPQEPQKGGEMIYNPTGERTDVKEAVAKLIYSLVQSDKTIAIANGEAALNIYNLYDKIQGLSDVTSFVEIADPAEPQLEEVPTGTHTEYQPVLDEDGSQIFDEEGQPVFEAVEVLNNENEVPKESASDKTIRHARESMRNMNSSFGAAISEIYTAEDEEGRQSYYTFVSVVDGKTVAAKRIGTFEKNDAPELLFHAIILMCQTVCGKIDAINQSKAASEEEERRRAEEEAAKAAAKAKKVSPWLIVLTVVIFLAAIGSAIFFAKTLTKQPEAQPSLSDASLSTESTTAPSSETSSEPSTADALIPIEPPATEVSVSETSAPFSSTSGTFVFTVYGYGHGVGLSQVGANYLAEQGWTYEQILANYYYGTTLMLGDNYPDSITYNGTSYQTRDFIAGALEAEMGSSYRAEALKAQAVAIYTFAKYYNYKLDLSSMAYKPTPSSASYAAADFVIKQGLYVAYSGIPALTPFHAISAGNTTSYYNVWGGTALTYLAGGRPSPGDVNDKEFKTTVTMTSAELKSTIEAADSSITLSGDPSTWLSILTHDAAYNENIGYVSAIRVGGKEFSGNDFRTKLLGGKIRSHCFSITYTPDAPQTTAATAPTGQAN